ncbi:MAG: DNA-3-methyladenine glycosylase [Ignavibacteriales bacterium]|nr:DNA-3-methyladenine glycosylase [Ignavibacteriales bacterium]MCF8406156.1 DNA-3-methyladenine glycosylase [Bacteroidales bacterium]
MNRLQESFYTRDVLDVAPDLLGKKLCIRSEDEIYSYYISEVEAYRGEEDKACHASKGRTPRTEVMYRKGGLIYIYLIYGMHWMFNIVCAEKDFPQAVLIRGLQELNGPGRITKKLKIDSSYNGESLVNSDRIWLENGNKPDKIFTSPRIGIEYAGEPWLSLNWRFFI